MGYYLINWNASPHHGVRVSFRKRPNLLRHAIYLAMGWRWFDCPMFYTDPAPTSSPNGRNALTPGRPEGGAGPEFPRAESDFTARPDVEPGLQPPLGGGPSDG